MNKDDWWIRWFDYPRLQLVFVLGLSALCWILSHDLTSISFDLGIGVFLTAATLYQLYRILPYTIIWRKKSLSATSSGEDAQQLSLLISNVLQTNRQADDLIELIREYDPDMLLTVETDQWWQDQLDAAIGESYPHTVKVPLDNLYGMHLYSKLSLKDATVRYRIKDDIPGIDTWIALENGQRINLYFVHPMPPSPSEAYASTSRDGELAMVGKEVKEKRGTTIVAGDLNDVAWSHSTRLFQRLSGLLDPRVGRGLYATFHADYWFARWPLDHVFHSSDLAIAELRRLPHIGSDHFPIYIRLSYEPHQDKNQGENPQGNDQQEAEKTIRHAQNAQEDTVA